MPTAFRNRFLAFVGAALACAPALAEPPAPTAPVSAATAPTTGKIRVALFADTGSMTGGDAVEKCLIKDPTRYECFRVTGEDIRNGALDKADIVVLGGGSGSKEAATLKPEGCEKIKTFVRNGGGYIGICAGAYLASSYYPWVAAYPECPRRGPRTLGARRRAASPDTRRQDYPCRNHG